MMHTLKTVHGWAMPDADRFMSAELKPSGEYQSANLQAALVHVTNWSLAIDCGSHVGTWSRLLSAVFARVIAVEPSPDSFEALTLNMNRFECRNVECRNVAVGAKRGFVSMVLDEKEAARANTGARRVQTGGTIRCEAIDDWQLPSLGFLKMDIEGSEPDALKGAALTIQRCKPIVLFEDKKFWHRYGHRPDAPHAFLTSLGYRHFARASADEIWGPA